MAVANEALQAVMEPAVATDKNYMKKLAEAVTIAALVEAISHALKAAVVLSAA